MLSYSVIVPTYNRGETISVTLDSLLAQKTTCHYDVIVVDNRSSDSTPDVVRSYSKVEYVFEGRQGLSHARNSGIARSCGDVVVFVDDDVIADPNWLEELHRVYTQAPDAWCVGGKIVLGLPENLPPWFDPSIRALSARLSGLDRGRETIKLSYPDDVFGVNFSVSRAALLSVGRFRTDLGRCGKSLLSGEETELCWRIQKAGGGVYYCGRAVVTHLVPQTRLNRAFFRRRAYWEGRTYCLLGKGRPLKEVIPLMLTFAKGQVKAALGHPVHPGLLLADSLAAWSYLGHLHQSILMVSRAARGHDLSMETGVGSSCG